MESASLEVRLNAFADIDLNGNLELGSGAQFPSDAVFHYDQLLLKPNSTSGSFDASFGGPPRIVLEGSLWILVNSSQISPNQYLIRSRLSPSRLNRLSRFDHLYRLFRIWRLHHLTLLDLAETFIGDKFNRKCIDAAIAVVNVINSLPTDEL